MCIKQNSSYMAGYQDAVAKFQSIFPAYQDSLVCYILMHCTYNPFSNSYLIFCYRYQQQDNDINKRQFNK